jgi:hypothetical protein
MKDLGGFNGKMYEKEKKCYAQNCPIINNMEES